MAAKKPRIVIIGAGMAGLAAANKLHTLPDSKDRFELCVVEGGNRVGGRICTSEIGGDRIEMGATWIHGIGGSPIYKIAEQIKALHSEQPWERMDGFPEDPITITEGGFKLDPSLVEPISSLYKRLMEFAKGKLTESQDDDNYYRIATKTANLLMTNGFRELSIGYFLRKGLDAYWASRGDREFVKDCGKWNKKSLEEAIFAMHENTERTYTSAGDLFQLDFNAEKEYREFPDEEITIAKGYSSIIKSLASVLPPRLIQLGRKVTKIDWQPNGSLSVGRESDRPVKLHFSDNSIMEADHVIVTVSLGILKAGIREEPGMFCPVLPSFKKDAISRLGFGVVNKLFLQLDTNIEKFPCFEMVFDQNAAPRQGEIPWWMRRTVTLCPIYEKSRVLLGWFAGQEALELEKLEEEEIVRGVSATLSNFAKGLQCKQPPNSHCINGTTNGTSTKHPTAKFAKVLTSKWGTDPLFMGSYSYVAVGSSGEDVDLMAEPLPNFHTEDSPPLQLLFAGEATHRTHYSTTHGAYLSGVREADRLIKHYSSVLP